MIKTVIVDDEQLSIDRLQRLLRDTGLASVAGGFTAPLEALAFLKENKVDVVFLDIEMPDMDGIELAGHIMDLQREAAVVFVTAYNQYAVEAFRLNALDYLMKPVVVERLTETIHRIMERKVLPASPVGAVHVRCFGRFSVMAGTREIRFRTEKAEELLAYLIDSRGSYVSRSRILDSLWEDFDGDRATVHFNSTLHNIKKALIPHGVKISIQYDRGNYQLDTEGLECDYLKFCRFAENAGKPCADDIQCYEEVAGLYLGEYLSGREFGWAMGKRTRLEELYIGLLLDIARYYRDAGDCQKAAGWLREGFNHAPLHRELNFRMIEALLLMNERMLAVRYFDLYRNGLMKKLKLEPDAAFRKLLRRT